MGLSLNRVKLFGKLRLMKLAKRQKKAQVKGARWHVWLELLRLPNLFTVPGDVFVGWMLAGMQGGFPLQALFASLSFYAAGLLLNDLADAKIDAKERPSRPIPSQRVTKRTVFYVTCGLFVIGILLAWSAWPMAVFLSALIVFYNLFAKHIAWMGVITMGACRGTNILLGASCATQGEMCFGIFHILAFLFFASYILGVSVVARNEACASTRVRWKMRALPLYFTISFLPLAFWYGKSMFLPIAVIFILQLPLLVFKYTVPQRVAAMIRLLIPLQCLWCIFLYPSLMVECAIVAVGLWMSSKLTAYRYAGS